MRTLLAIAALPLLLAQDEKRPQFEVASIKPTAPGTIRSWGSVAPGGRVEISNMTLSSVIQYAWGVRPFQISGGAAWIDSLHYDITAKAEGDPKGDEILLMLQGLLEDRFQLRIHRETKEAPIYALVLARKDGKLGSGLILAQEGGCVKFDRLAPPAPGQPRVNYCGGMMMNPKMIKGVSVPVGKIVPLLSRLLGRTVIDKTGLTGAYDINLEWTPDEAQIATFPPDMPRPEVDPEGPSIFTAIQEQLGLKLESQKGPVEMLVIDRVEKPSEN